MAKNFNELRGKMSPERQRRNAAEARRMLLKMTPFASMYPLHVPTSDVRRMFRKPSTAVFTRLVRPCGCRELSVPSLAGGLLTYLAHCAAHYQDWVSGTLKSDRCE